MGGPPGQAARARTRPYARILAPLSHTTLHTCSHLPPLPPLQQPVRHPRKTSDHPGQGHSISEANQGAGRHYWLAQREREEGVLVVVFIVLFGVLHVRVTTAGMETGRGRALQPTRAGYLQGGGLGGLCCPRTPLHCAPVAAQHPGSRGEEIGIRLKNRDTARHNRALICRRRGGEGVGRGEGAGEGALRWQRGARAPGQQPCRCTSQWGGAGLHCARASTKHAPEPPCLALPLQQRQNVALAHRPLHVAHNGAVRVVQELHAHLSHVASGASAAKHLGDLDRGGRGGGGGKGRGGQGGGERSAQCSSRGSLQPEHTAAGCKAGTQGRHTPLPA